VATYRSMEAVFELLFEITVIITFAHRFFARFRLMWRQRPPISPRW
jgi:hypothetical protein